MLHVWCITRTMISCCFVSTIGMCLETWNFELDVGAQPEVNAVSLMVRNKLPLPTVQLVRNDMDVNEHEKLSSITLIRPKFNKGKKHFYCCSTFHSNSRVIGVPAFVSFNEGNITYITQYTGKRTFFSHQMCVMCKSQAMDVYCYFHIWAYILLFKCL